jgi:hypothetical protein
VVIAMLGSTAEPHLRWDLPDNPAGLSGMTTDDLAVGIAHLIAGAVMNIAGPLFWAVIVLGLMADVLGIDLFL